MDSKLLTSFSLTKHNIAEQVQWIDYSKQFRNLSSTKSISKTKSHHLRGMSSSSRNQQKIQKGGGDRQPKKIMWSPSLPIFFLSTP